MKNKLKYLPFNLFWCVGTFSTTFFVCWEMPLHQSIGLSFIMYMLDVKQSVNQDYLEGLKYEKNYN